MEAGEGSSSRGKRVRVSSIADEAKAPSGTLYELDLLDCPVCYHPLKTPIYQCKNGHVVCSSCCTQVRKKCPACTLSTGNSRNRILESIVEAVIVPCPNAEHGCTRKFSYGKELVHEKKCGFALCYCPAPNCTYTGTYKDLYRHYNDKHMDPYNNDFSFVCDNSRSAWLLVSDKVVVLQEYKEGPLVAIQCFKEAQGVYLSVNCKAPCAPGIGKFSFKLSYTMGGKTMSFESEEMTRIQKVSFETPDKDFMVIPTYFPSQDHSQFPVWKFNISIRRREAVEEEEEE